MTSGTPSLRPQCTELAYGDVRCLAKARWTVWRLADGTDAAEPCNRHLSRVMIRLDKARRHGQHINVTGIR